MAAKIDFYFDFSSSYSYLALPGVAKLADDPDVTFAWKPIALGAIFQAHGHAPPIGDTPKGRYVRHDVERCAARAGLPYRWPEPFPFSGIAASRIYWHLAERDADKAVAWAQAVFHASFGEGRDCSNPEVLASVATALGHDAEELLSVTADEGIKTKLKNVTGEAMDRGVFGAPTFFVGDEMFWGADRLGHLESFIRGD